jgi:hypothetical protein
MDHNFMISVDVSTRTMIGKEDFHSHMVGSAGQAEGAMLSQEGQPVRQCRLTISRV